MTMTDPQPTAYLARVRAWRYEGADAIEVLDAPQGPLVLRAWHTPVFHLADGSTTVSIYFSAEGAKVSVPPVEVKDGYHLREALHAALELESALREYLAVAQADSSAPSEAAVQ